MKNIKSVVLTGIVALAGVFGGMGGCQMTPEGRRFGGAVIIGEISNRNRGNNQNNVIVANPEEYKDYVSLKNNKGYIPGKILLKNFGDKREITIYDTNSGTVRVIPISNIGQFQDNYPKAKAIY
jgi:hypothetical protein